MNTIDTTRTHIHRMWSAVAPAWADHATYVDERSHAEAIEMLKLTDPRPGERVLELAYEHMNNPELVRIEPDNTEVPPILAELAVVAGDSDAGRLIEPLARQDPTAAGQTAPFGTDIVFEAADLADFSFAASASGSLCARRCATQPSICAASCRLATAAMRQ